MVLFPSQAMRCGLAKPIDGLETWYNLSQALGCGGPESGPATAEYARQKTVDEVYEAADAVAIGTFLQPDFSPWIDDKTVFTDVRDRAAKGNFVKRVCNTGLPSTADNMRLMHRH